MGSWFHGRGRRRLDRQELLTRLDRIEQVPSVDADELDRDNLARAVLSLAGLDQDTEYLLCRQVAGHLLGHDPGAAEAS